MSNTTPDSAGIGFLAAYLRQVYACSGAAFWGGGCWRGGGAVGGGGEEGVCLSGYEEAPQITSDCPGEARKDKTETPQHLCILTAGDLWCVPLFSAGGIQSCVHNRVDRMRLEVGKARCLLLALLALFPMEPK